MYANKAIENNVVSTGYILINFIIYYRLLADDVGNFSS